jgi:hypothetical protein
MPYRMYMWERRDNGDRNIMAVSSLTACRIMRKTDGISSAKFYWVGLDSIAMLVEGTNEALNTPFAGSAPGEAAKSNFDMADNARFTMDIRLIDAKAGEDAAKNAGRA